MANASPYDTQKYNPGGQMTVFNDNPLSRWWFGTPSAGESQEAFNAFRREADFNAAEAEKTRQFEKMMSDTAVQRRVADLQRAGFSGLAALGDVSASSTPSGATASAHSSPAQAKDTFTPLLRSIVEAVGGIAGKVVSHAMGAMANQELASTKATGAMERELYRAASRKEIERARSATQRELQMMRNAQKDRAGDAWKERAADKAKAYRNKKERSSSDDGVVISPEELEAALKKAFGEE